MAIDKNAVLNAFTKRPESVSGAYTISGAESNADRYIYSDVNRKLANISLYQPDDFVVFPLTGSRHTVPTSAFDIVTDETAINGAIHNILYTKLGERVMEPDFGVDLHRYLFELMTPEMIASLQAGINRAFTVWDSRFRCKKIIQKRAGNELFLEVTVEIIGIPREITMVIKRN